MKHRHTLKEYLEFKPAERLALVLAALDREDYNYARLLESTAVSAGFRDYATLITACMYAGSVLCVHLVATQVYINLIVQSSPDTPHEPPPHLAVPFNEFMAWQFNVWLAFSQSCKGIGLEPRQVLRFAPITHDDREFITSLVYDIVDRLEQDSECSTKNERFRRPEDVAVWRKAFDSILNPPEEHADGPLFQRVLAPIPPVNFSELAHPSEWQPFPPPAPAQDS